MTATEATAGELLALAKHIQDEVLKGERHTSLRFGHRKWNWITEALLKAATLPAPASDAERLALAGRLRVYADALIGLNDLKIGDLTCRAALIEAADMLATATLSGEAGRVAEEAEDARAEDVLRGLASYLAVGGYNSDTFDPDVFDGKIRYGIDLLTKPLETDAQRYRRLRSIGAAPNGTVSLKEGLVFVASNLDDWIDALIAGKSIAPSHAAEGIGQPEVIAPTPADREGLREKVSGIVSIAMDNVADRRVHGYAGANKLDAELADSSADAILALLPAQPSASGDHSFGGYGSAEAAVAAAAGNGRTCRETFAALRSIRDTVDAALAMQWIDPAQPSAHDAEATKPFGYVDKEGKLSVSGDITREQLLALFPRNIGFGCPVIPLYVHPAPQPATQPDSAGWRDDMENAPRDGRAVLTQHQDDLYPIAAFQIDGHWLRQTEGPEDVYGPGKWEPLHRRPTHWRELPESPLVEAERRALTPAASTPAREER